MPFTQICHRCDVFGIRLATLGNDGLLMHTWTPHGAEKVWNQHSSDGLHVGVENIFDELSVQCVTWLSDSARRFTRCLLVSLLTSSCLRNTDDEWACRWNPYGEQSHVLREEKAHRFSRTAESKSYRW